MEPTSTDYNYAIRAVISLQSLRFVALVVTCMGQPILSTISQRSVSGVVARKAAFQAVDLGSISGWRRFDLI